MIPAIGLVCLGVACLAKPKRRKKITGLPPTKYAKPCAAQVCEDLPWDGDTVTAVMVELVNNGVREANALTAQTLRTVYPMSPSGQVLHWPTNPQDCESMRLLESRAFLRAERLIAEVLDNEAEQLWYSRGGF